MSISRVGIAAVSVVPHANQARATSYNSIVDAFAVALKDNARARNEPLTRVAPEDARVILRRQAGQSKYPDFNVAMREGLNGPSFAQALNDAFTKLGV